MKPYERLIMEGTAVPLPPEEEEESLFLDPIGVQEEDDEIDDDYINDGGGQ